MARVYNGDMKKWQRRTAMIFLLSAAGTAALLMRPAFLEDTQTDYSPTAPSSIVMRENDVMSLQYRWYLKDSPTHTLLLGDTETLQQLAGEPMWAVSLRFENGQLKVESAAPRIKAADRFTAADSRFYVLPCGTSLLHMPDGDIHVQYHFRLACEITLTPSFFRPQQHLIAMQELMVDVADKAADLVPTSVPASMAHLPAVTVFSGKEPALPSRFCGTAAEQGLEKTLFHLAQLTDARAVTQQLPILRANAAQLVELYADADQPWPQCWGTAAAKAEEVAVRIIPLLQRLDEADCYGNQELIDFINGPVFMRLFGAGKAPEPSVPSADSAEQSEE